MEEATKGEHNWRLTPRHLPTAHMLDGIPVPDAASGSDSWDEDPDWLQRVVNEVAHDVAIDLDVAEWHDARPILGRRLRDPGAVPRSMGRSAWLVRFNPAMFDGSDPYDYFDWNDPVRALDRPLVPEALTKKPAGSRTMTTVANYLRDVAVGDVLFVLRTPPTSSDRSPTDDPLGLRRVAHLIGVLWVEVKADFLVGNGRTWPQLRYVPLVQFTEPVPVPQARAWIPGLTGVSALRLPSGFLALRSHEAVAVAAACSLPLEIFSVDHSSLPTLSTHLRRLDTGPVQPLRDYLASATIRYEKLREIEGRAMAAVKDIYRKNFTVVDVSGRRRLGYDLAVGHAKTRSVNYQVEVKGTSKQTDTTVALTDHEYAAAELSAAAADGRWWLYVVTKALQRVPDQPIPRQASAIVPAWRDRISNPLAAAANPLRRLNRLPRRAWGRPV